MNNTETDQILEPLRQAAERVIAHAVGGVVTLTSITRLTEPERNTTLCRVTATGAPAGAFIIKQGPGSLKPTWSSDNFADQRFRNDWAGAEFLAGIDVGPPLGPRFYGGEAGLGFFVIEDLGEHRSLVQPLLQGGDAAGAEAGLLKYAASLGRLHATTIGRAPALQAVFADRFPGQAPFGDELLGFAERVKLVHTFLEQLGGRPPAGLAAEIETVAQAAAEPGPFLAYLHSDPCPDNLFDRGDDFQLIDFEWSHFGHALQDGLYPRLIWPSCWCVGALPLDVLGRVERRYRAGLARGCTAAQDDAVWAQAVAHMSALTLLNRLGWELERMLEGDHTWGRATTRQRMLARLEAFIRTAEEFDRLPALRGMAEQLLTALRGRWSETIPLPLYPAFQPET